MKHRPRALWFFVGGGLVLVAIVVFVVGLVLTIRSSTDTDATFRTSGPIGFDSEPGTERMLFVRSGAAEPSCTVRDGTGAERPLDHPAATTTVTTGGTEWTGFATFDSGDGNLTIRCTTVTRIRVGDPLGAGFVVRLLVTILAPMGLGLLGMAVLVVTAVLWFTRPPRAVAASAQR